MKRRHFLSLSGLVSGACLIPTGIARRIRSTALRTSGPLFLAPENAWIDLYADFDGGGFNLHLGDPNAEPQYPNLSDFIGNKGFNPDIDEDLREYAVEWRRYEPDFDEEEEGAIAMLKEELNHPIDGMEREKWLEWEFKAFENPMAQAYHYLSGLTLKNLNCAAETDRGLGGVDLIEGHIGSNYDPFCYVDSLQALASLQHRLNELDEGACIRII